MGQTTSIEWTDRTWNPIRGCSRVSEGCRNCYAERIAARFSGSTFGNVATRTGWNGKAELYVEKLDEPLHWRKPCRVFVNSMSDLFHERLSDLDVCRVFGVMARASRHTFQVLTKRPERMHRALREIGFANDVAVYAEWDEPVLPWPLPNVWLGVSVENQETADERIPLLLQTPAAVRFLSIEPLLGPVDLRAAGVLLASTCTCSEPWKTRACMNDACHERGSCSAIDWVIVGGESGPGARPMHPDWVRTIRDQCQAAGVPFFFKQWGEWRHILDVTPDERTHLLNRLPTRLPKDPERALYQKCTSADNDGWLRVGKKNAGRELDGRTWDEFPQVAA